MSAHETTVIVNEVGGFNPMAYARPIPSKIEGQPAGLYLDVKHRITWFRLAHLTGKISKSIHKLDDKMAIVECRIYKDANDSPEAYLSNGFGQRYYDDSTPYGTRYLECAETAAIGRALAAAGFNISSVGDVDDDDRMMVDSAVPTVSGEHDAGNPSSKKASPHPPASPHPHTSEVMPTPSPSSYTASSSVEEISRIMSIEEAQRIVISFNGKHNGKTLGQVAVDDPSTLEWIMKNYNGKDNILRAGAQILINAALKSAA